MRSVLKREGYEVLTAKDGREALELLRGNDSISIITTDNNMPGMSGVEFLQAAEEISPTAMRIMISSSRKEELKPILDRPGFLLSFHTKPASMSDVLSSVELGTRLHDKKSKSRH